MKTFDPDQDFSKTMTTDTEFRRYEKASVARDARRFEEYTKNDVARALARVQGGVK